MPIFEKRVGSPFKTLITAFGVNVKPRKIGVLIMLSIMLLLLSSCVEVEYKITINKNGSCDVLCTYLMNSTLVGLAEQSGSSNPLTNLRESAENDGYQISNLTTSDKTGFQAKKHIDNLEAALAKGDPFGTISAAFPIQPAKELKIEKSMFTTKYSIDTDIDLSSLSTNSKEDSTDWSNALSESMMQTMKVTFILGLPVKIVESNASLTEDKGETLIWNLIPGQHNKITANINLPNPIGYIIVGSVIICSLLVAVIILMRKKQVIKKT